MRCRSSKGVTAGGLALGAVALFIVLTGSLLVVVSNGDAEERAPLPAKSSRTGSPGHDGGPPPGEAVFQAGGGLFSEEDLVAFSAAADKLLASEVEGESAALEEALEMQGGLQGGSDELRRALLEEAARLSLHAEEPWKNLVLVALAYHGDGDRPPRDRWFERAIRLAVDPDDPRRTSLAMRDVVRGLLSARLYEQAESLTLRIPEPSVRELSRADLAASLAGRQRFTDALVIASSLSDRKARSTALRGIAQARARAGEIPEAITTALQINDDRMRDDALMRVALVQAGRGDVAGADSVLRHIRNERTRELGHVRLAESQARKPGGAPESLLALVHDPFLRDESLRRLVEVEVERMNVDEARAAMFRIESRSERAQAMESLVALQARKGDLRGALSQAQAIDVEDSRIRALQTVAVAEVGARGAPSARNVASMILDPEQRDVAYRRVAVRAAQLGRYREAGHTILNILSPVEAATARAAVATTRARRGSFGPARLLIQDAERDVAEIPQRKKQARALSMLAEAYAEMRDSGTAMTTAAGIDDAGMRDRTYQALSRKFAVHSEVELAEFSAQSIIKETTRDRALDEVVRTVAARTRATEALRRVKVFDSRRQQVRFLLAVAQRI